MVSPAVSRFPLSTMLAHQVRRLSTVTGPISSIVKCGKTYVNGKWIESATKKTFPVFSACAVWCLRPAATPSCWFFMQTPRLWRRLATALIWMLVM